MSTSIHFATFAIASAPSLLSAAASHTTGLNLHHHARLASYHGAQGHQKGTFQHCMDQANFQSESSFLTKCSSDFLQENKPCRWVSTGDSPGKHSLHGSHGESQWLLLNKWLQILFFRIQVLGWVELRSEVCAHLPKVPNCWSSINDDILILSWIS